MEQRRLLCELAVGDTFQIVQGGIIYKKLSETESEALNGPEPNTIAKWIPQSKVIPC
jgi:hypothetical protein